MSSLLYDNCSLNFSTQRGTGLYADMTAPNATPLEERLDLPRLPRLRSTVDEGGGLSSGAISIPNK